MNSTFNRRGFLGLCSLAIVGLGSGIEADAQTLKLPPIVRAKFENGIEIALMEYHKAPLLSVIAMFRGGEALDPDSKAGVAGLTAELLRKGTQKRTATQIAEEIDFLGGSLSTGADNDSLTASLYVSTKDTDAGLELFADVIRNATFPQEELDRERQLQVAGLQSLADEPGQVANLILNQTVYEAHPYGRSATITSLGTITRDDITAYSAGVVRPERMLIVAVGDFKASAFLEKLKAHFGEWSVAGEAKPLETRKPAPMPKRFVLVDKKDATQTQARWGRIALPRNHPDYFAVEVASGILGGGFTSRLVDEIRVNQSLTYGIGSAFGMEALGGDFHVSTFTKLETTRKLIDSVEAVLKTTADKGFTTGEVAKVKGYLAGQYAIGLQTPQALAAQLAEMVFHRLPNDYLTTYITKLKSVPIAELNRVAREHFTPSQLSLILVAPADKIKAQLSGLPTPDIRPVEQIGK
jgi:zinc protease